MLSHTGAFSGFSTNDLAAARAFYAETLGLAVEEGDGMLNLQLHGGQRVQRLPMARSKHLDRRKGCLAANAPIVLAPGNGW